MKQKLPLIANDETSVLLGSKVRRVLAHRYDSDQIPPDFRGVREAARVRRRLVIGWRVALGGGSLALVLLALLPMLRGHGGALTYTTSGARLLFSDGSHVVSGRDSHVSVVGLTGRGAHLQLSGGAVQLGLLGRPGSAWTIDAGPYTLAAAQVSAELTWSAKEATLSTRVRHGHVLVRGPFGNRGEVQLWAEQELLARAQDRTWRIDGGRSGSRGRCSPPRAGASHQTEPLRLDDRGCLAYGSDERGNRIPDFSHAGYRGGGVPVPFVPSARDRLPVTPGLGGDDTAAIQTAIDVVSARPVDRDGFRGVVELSAGTFTLAGTVHIRTSGVVVRGQGDTGPNATVIRAVGAGRSVVVIGLPARPLAPGRSHRVSDGYVPVGARTFEVEDADDLQAGDEIVVQGSADGPVTAPDVEGMRSVAFERRIKDIDGRRITLDVPVTTALDRELGEATVARYTPPDRIAGVGVELLAGRADFDPKSDLGDGILVKVDGAINAWIRQVRAEGYHGGVANLGPASKWVTVEDANVIGPLVSHAGGWSRAFMLGGQQNLILRGRAWGVRHALDTWTRSAGPNVVLDLAAIGKSSVVTPGRGTHGLLLDQVRLADDAGEPAGAIVIGNRDDGRGRGWSAVNAVLWNCSANRLAIDSPPTAQNWVIGGGDGDTSGGAFDDTAAPSRPKSLYRAQLAERLGESALAALAR
jgi:hypothetical protein